MIIREVSETFRSYCCICGLQWQSTAQCLGSAFGIHRTLGLCKFPKTDVGIDASIVSWLDTIARYSHLTLFWVGSDNINNQWSMKRGKIDFRKHLVQYCPLTDAYTARPLTFLDRQMFRLILYSFNLNWSDHSVFSSMIMTSLAQVTTSTKHEQYFNLFDADFDGIFKPEERLSSSTSYIQLSVSAIPSLFHFDRHAKKFTPSNPLIFNRRFLFGLLLFITDAQSADV